MSFDSDEDSIIEEDYYACLNISKEATPEEITSAYRRLSKLYHPDKHTDADQKVKADLLFNKIKKAYEILSDPHQRAIYDTIGPKGLKTDGWAIVPRTKTPQEIRDEYERLAREQNERRLQQRTNPRGNIIININATDIFAKYDDDYDEFLERSFFPIIEISAMSMSQAIEAPLTLRDTLTLQGDLAAQNGTGSGSFIVSGKRLISSNGWIEAEFAAGNGPVAALKLSRSLTRTIFGNFATQLKFTPSGARFGFVVSLGMPLDRYTQGYLTWNIGFASSMTTIIVRDTEKSHSSMGFSLGVTSSFVSASQTWKINKADLKLRIYCKLGTISSVVECSAEKKVSEQSFLGATVSVGVPSGVILKIKINRARQTYIFPIQLCEEPRLMPSMYAVVTPLIVYFTVKKLLVEPFMKEQKEKKIEKQREVNKNRMEEKKREAKAAVDLMKATYERIHAEEESRNGLLIIRALYGKDADVVAKSDAPSLSQLREVIDVTVPVQCLVKNSQLVIHNTSKSQLSGFYDPCVGEEKVLYVKYTFHSHVCEATVADQDALRIPKQSQRVNSS